MGQTLKSSVLRYVRRPVMVNDRYPGEAGTSCGASVLPPHLGEPPAQPDEEETPVMEELGRFALRVVAGKLENPADHEQCDGYRPEIGPEKHNGKQRYGAGDHWNANRVADAVYRMPVALRIFSDPVLGWYRGHCASYEPMVRPARRGFSVRPSRDPSMG